MTDLEVQPRQARHFAWQAGVLGAAALLLLIVTVRTSTSLYFVWEEWGHLWDAVATPFWGLMQSHFGYVSPLGRLLFLLEAKVFGHWYVGYAVVNALLLIAVVGLMWRTLRPTNPWSSWAFTGGLVAFLFSGGALFAVNFAAMDAYFLCWLFGMLALTAWRAHKPVPLVLALFLAAALSSTLMNVVVTTFVVSMMIGLGRPGAPAALRWTPWRGPLGYAVFAMSISFLLFLIGRAFPSVDPNVGVSQSVTSVASADPIAQLLPLAAFLVTWLVSPFIGVIAVSQNLYERAVILLIDRPYLVAIALAVVTAAMVLAAMQRIGGVGWRRSVLTGLLLASALGFAVQIIVFRGEQSFQVRYTLMWMPAVVVFWAWWIDNLMQVRATAPRGAAIRGVARLTAVSMVIAGIVLATLSPFLVDQAVDVIRPRTELSIELKDAVQLCGEIDEPDVADVLAPGMPWQAVCDSAGFLRR